MPAALEGLPRCVCGPDFLLGRPVQRYVILLGGKMHLVVLIIHGGWRAGRVWLATSCCLKMKKGNCLFLSRKVSFFLQDF